LRTQARRERFAIAVVLVALALPLVRRRVPRNRWYGVRLPESFASDEAWFDINAYGGRCLMIFGAVVAVTAATGSQVSRAHWSTYNWSALGVIGGALMVLVVVVLRYARHRWPRR
jgi:uncharacterized membrane protein